MAVILSRLPAILKFLPQVSSTVPTSRKLQRCFQPPPPLSFQALPIFGTEGSIPRHHHVTIHMIPQTTPHHSDCPERSPGTPVHQSRAYLHPLALPIWPSCGTPCSPLILEHVASSRPIPRPVLIGPLSELSQRASLGFQSVLPMGHMPRSHTQPGPERGSSLPSHLSSLWGRHSCCCCLCNLHPAPDSVSPYALCSSLALRCWLQILPVEQMLSLKPS